MISCSTYCHQLPRLLLVVLLVVVLLLADMNKAVQFILSLTA
jgi:hypothetical protein